MLGTPLVALRHKNLLHVSIDLSLSFRAPKIMPVARGMKNNDARSDWHAHSDQHARAYHLTIALIDLYQGS